MSNVIHRTTLEFYPSVNEPDYPEPTWKWNPDMTAVAGVPGYYWKAPADWNAVGAGPVVMSQAEKDAVDAAMAAADAAALVDRQTLNFPGLSKGDFAVYDGTKVRRFPVGTDDQLIVADSTQALGVNWKNRVIPIAKQANQTKTANTTFADDDTLLFAAAANGVYVFRFRVFFDTTSSADFKFRLNGPTSPTGIRIARKVIAPAATALSLVAVDTAFGTTVAVTTTTGTTGGYVEIDGGLVNGANAGNVAFQWAQNSSDAGNTIVLKGSYLEYAKVG